MKATTIIDGVPYGISRVTISKPSMREVLEFQESARFARKRRLDNIAQMRDPEHAQG
jgi:hypothetical protein